MNRLLFMFLAAPALCAAADPFVATWKPTELEKWKISPGGKGEEAKSRLVITELVGKDTFRNTRTALDGKGPVEVGSTFVYDGKERKGLNDTTVKGDRIDERHLRLTISSGKGTVVEDFVVAPDGKTQALTRKGIGTSSGRHVDELYFFERQPSVTK